MLPNNSRIGGATLLVRDLQLIAGFYRTVIRLEIIKESPDEVVLGSAGSNLLYLKSEPDLPYPPSGEAGLYHLAFLYSHPAQLARTLERVFSQAPSLYQGSADHLVSEAFYLSDPEGNGIELYVDRDRSEWKRENGSIVMGSLPLDPQRFISAHTGIETTSSISLGHAHLKVGNISAAKAFYCELLGFDVIFEMPTALFASAGGYHHHVGLNTWESLGAGKRQESLGLKEITITLGDASALENIRTRLENSRYLLSSTDSSLLLEDPWGTLVRIHP